MRPTAVARVWGRSSTTSTTGDSFVNANAPEHDKLAEAAGPRRDAPPGPPRGEARPRPSVFDTTLPVSTKRGRAIARKHALVKRRATGIQGNRANRLRCDEAGEVVVVPCGDLSP